MKTAKAQTQNLLDRLLSSMPFILALWGTFLALHVILKLVPTHNYSDWFDFLIAIGVETIVVYYLVWLWINSESTTRRIFAFFTFSICSIIFAALAYEIFFNLPHISLSSTSNILLLSLYNIPYLGFLLFQLIAWATVLYVNNADKGSRRPFLYVPVAIISSACLSLFFFIFDFSSIHHWTEEKFFHDFYGLFQSLLQIVSFLAAILCLAITKKKGIFYLALSYLIITAVNMVMNFGIFTQSYGTGSFVEIFWRLGLLLRIYALATVKKEGSFALSPKEWMCRLNDLRTQNTLWVVSCFMLGAYTVSILYYITSPAGTIEGRLLQIMVSTFIFSLIFVVALGNWYGRELCYPLDRMTRLINIFLSDEPPKKPVKEEDYPTVITQFRRLESFMLKAFNTLEQKLSKEKELTEVTSLVAHDIRKPFAKLKIMLRTLPKLTSTQIEEYSEDLDLTIRKVESMLSDIVETAQDIKYKLNPGNVLKVLDLSIKEVSRYRPEKSVDFHYKLDSISLVDLDEQRMCRVFENLINNAFDCLPEKEGFMWFSVSAKKDTAEIIIGNGHSHIPKDDLDEIFRTGFTSGKKSGTGLGLGVVSKVIRGHNGSVIARNVKHAPNFVPSDIRDIQGVEFVVTLPIVNKTEGYTLREPILYNSQEAKIENGMVYRKARLAGASKIDLLAETLRERKTNAKILILDDESIYRMHFKSVWDKLSEIKVATTLLDASSYKEAIEILEQTEIDYLICDIDLSDNEYNGFDVLKFAREKYPKCRVLVHTNKKDPLTIAEAKELGACGFCPKPMAEAVLVDFLLKRTLWPVQKDESKKKSKTVIFLNDDKNINENTKLLMEDTPYDLETFIDVRSALAFYRRTENVYAILSDINLKGDLDGYDFLGEIRLGNKKIPFIIISGKSYNDECENARKMGATKYIQIPFKTEKLIEVLNGLESRDSGNVELTVNTEES